MASVRFKQVHAILNSASIWNLQNASSQLITKRCFHTTQKLNFEESPHTEDAIKVFKDFKYPNQVTTFEHYKMPKELLDHEYNYPICRDTMGIKWPGYWFKRKFVYVKEMEPELVVPDLDDFELKPYVSYRVEDIDTKPFTAKDLFDAVYAEGIINSYKQEGVDKYDVTQEEIDAARLSAMQTGADLFEEAPVDGVRAPIKYVMEPN